MKISTTLLINSFLERHNKLVFLKSSLLEAAEIICTAAKNDNFILLCGNGGSAADSEHMAAELLKSFVLPRPISSEAQEDLNQLLGPEEGNYISQNLQQGLRCIPLVSFSALNTAFINDCSPDFLFAQLIHILGRKNDILIAFSTSGNSKNVCYAAKVAKAKGLKVVSFTGENGGKLKYFSNVLLNAPSNIVYQIQEFHLPLYHILCLVIENELFGN